MLNQQCWACFVFDAYFEQRNHVYEFLAKCQRSLAAPWWLNRQTTCISLLRTSLNEGGNAIFLHLNEIAEKHHINAEFVNIKCQWTVRQLIFCRQCCIGRQKLQCCTELKINVEFNIYLPQVFNFYDVFGIDKKWQQHRCLRNFTTKIISHSTIPAFGEKNSTLLVNGKNISLLHNSWGKNFNRKSFSVEGYREEEKQHK